MGAGASTDGAIDVDTAKTLAGDQWDEEKWTAAEKDGEGKVSKATWEAAACPPATTEAAEPDATAPAAEEAAAAPAADEAASSS